VDELIHFENLYGEKLAGTVKKSIAARLVSKSGIFVSG